MQGVAGPWRKEERKGGHLGKLWVLIMDYWIAQDSENSSQHLLKTELCQVIYKLLLVLSSMLQNGSDLPLLKEEDIEAQGGYVTCPRSHG